MAITEVHRGAILSLREAVERLEDSGLLLLVDESGLRIIKAEDFGCLFLMEEGFIDLEFIDSVLSENRT